MVDPSALLGAAGHFALHLFGIRSDMHWRAVKAAYQLRMRTELSDSA
jgi:hypothetical protein